MSASTIKVVGNIEGSSLIIGDNNTVTITYSSSSTLELPPGSNPFRGLEAFDELSHQYFFGREEIVAHIASTIERTHADTAAHRPRLHALLGPSGAGKSSIVRAGLLPYLAASDTSCWRDAVAVLMRPGFDPIANLADALRRMLARQGYAQFSVDALAERIEGVSNTSSNTADIIFKDFRQTATMMIIIDQFEEIYSLAVASDSDTLRNRRRLFVRIITDMAESSRCNISIVPTVRSDFFGTLSQIDPHLSDLIAKGHSLVPALSRANLRRAIVGPLAVKLEEIGSRSLPQDIIDEATIVQILRDAERDSAALPLFQFTLSEIWEAVAAGATATAVLAKLGGVGGALATRADDILGTVPPETKDLVRKVMVGSVQIGDVVAHDTRRRLQLQDLVGPTHSISIIQQAIEPFVSERLLTVGSNDDGIWVELTHEALIRSWTRLAEWIEQQRDALRFAQSVQSTVRLWTRNNRPKGSLWREPDLSLLRRHKDFFDGHLPSLQQDFLDASEKLARREARLRRYAVAGLALLLVMASIGLVTALFEANLAKKEKRRTDIALAESLSADDHPNAAIQELSQYVADRSDDSGFEADVGNALVHALSRDHLLASRAMAHVSAISWGDPNTLTVWTKEGTFELSADLHSLRPIAYREPPTADLDYNSHQELWSPDHSRKIDFLDLQRIELEDQSGRTIIGTDDGQTSSGEQLNKDEYRFSPDSRLLYISHRWKQRVDARPEVVQTSNGKREFALELASTDLAVFSPNSDKLATYDGSRIYLWSTADNIFSSYNSTGARFGVESDPDLWFADDGSHSYVFDSTLKRGAALSDRIPDLKNRDFTSVSDDRAYSAVTVNNFSYVINNASGKIVTKLDTRDAQLDLQNGGASVSRNPDGTTRYFDFHHPEAGWQKVMSDRSGAPVTADADQGMVDGQSPYWKVSNGFLFKVVRGRRIKRISIKIEERNKFPDGQYSGVISPEMKETSQPVPPFGSRESGPVTFNAFGDSLICNDGPCMFVENGASNIIYFDGAGCAAAVDFPSRGKFLCTQGTEIGVLNVISIQDHRWSVENVIPPEVAKTYPDDRFVSYYFGPAACQQSLIQIETDHTSGGYFGAELWDTAENIPISHFDGDQYLIAGSSVAKHLVGDQPTLGLITPSGHFFPRAHAVPVLCNSKEERQQVRQSLVAAGGLPSKSIVPSFWQILTGYFK